METWKPTQAQVDLIKRAAAMESQPHVQLSAVILEPGWRCNTEEPTRPSSMNVALVSDQPDWNDTDLADYGEWASFRKGVELTHDGRAIVDFYIRRRGDQDRELCGNVSVYYQGGRIVRIQGYPGEYGGEPEA